MDKPAADPLTAELPIITGEFKSALMNLFPDAAHVSAVFVAPAGGAVLAAVKCALLSLERRGEGVDLVVLISNHPARGLAS